MASVNFQPGDYVKFGDDDATGRVVAMGYPMCRLDFGRYGGEITCFTGGITRKASSAEIEEFKRKNAEASTPRG